jgi:hypothetical protein
VQVNYVLDGCATVPPHTARVYNKRIDLLYRVGRVLLTASVTLRGDQIHMTSPPAKRCAQRS